jgi:hypothetical protein
VSENKNPREADFESASSQLNEGLKTCHTMVANYRAMLRGDNEDRAASNDDQEYFSGSESA